MAHGKPLTNEEVKARLRNIKKEQIVFADSRSVNQRKQTLDRILRAMGEVADMDWSMDTVFISDMSSVSDFLDQESELTAVAEKLGLDKVEKRENLIDLALRLEPKI